ncbi:MAG TPA: sigma factor, partial [Ktedonobacterales bacterium]|nr:sigma factor [Ktedonobacterales bacterium]
MSIVFHWKARERRPPWTGLLAERVFALRTRMQDGDGHESDASASPKEANTLFSQAAHPAKPGGGEDAAFDAFFTQYEHALYGYLRRMLPTHDAALDVAQEAFFRAWQRFDMIRGYDRP